MRSMSALGICDRGDRSRTIVYVRFAPKADKRQNSRLVRLVPISLQKSPRRKARCALAPNTSLNLEGDYADDRQRDQGDLTLTSHMRRAPEVAVRRAWPTCAGSERLLPA